MKIVVKIQLKPTKEQSSALRETLERCNAACNHIAKRGLETETSRQFDLHRLCYAETKQIFGLVAQSVVRSVAKVAHAYKTIKAGGNVGALPAFRALAAQPYDHHIFRFCGTSDVNIWSVRGRLTMPFVCGPKQRALLASRKGEVRLMFVRRKWYVDCVCDVAEAPEREVGGALGLDFGIANIAFDSLGTSYSGDDVERVRGKFEKRRGGIQRRGTRAARRKLRTLGGKEARFRRHTNHCISKKIVECAERSSLAIAMEDLTHIRKRVKAKRAHRGRLHSWSFWQLRKFITYKAQLQGVPVLAVNPRNTSRTCPSCRSVHKGNRKQQAVFSCLACGHTDHADFVAATNIALLAAGAAHNPALSSRPEGAGKSCP